MRDIDTPANAMSLVRRSPSPSPTPSFPFPFLSLFLNLLLPRFAEGIVASAVSSIVGRDTEEDVLVANGEELDLCRF